MSNLAVPSSPLNLSAPPVPTPAERFLFETQGYLVLENFLAADHVARLLAALDPVVARRREQVRTGEKQTGFTHTDGTGSTRIFYILDDHPLFLELLDWPAMLPYVTGLLNARPHHCASDAIVSRAADFPQYKLTWHIDGHDDGFRNLGRPIPLLQLKLGYYLSDMTAPGNGNLTVVPGSHQAGGEPDPEAVRRGDLLPGAVQVCAPAGSAILFHNALWHTAGPFAPDGRRTMLYYAYEHPWMIASQEHWGYPKEFYNQRLSAAQRKFFHGFLFDPPEARWG
jgi:ectoine hydroxylase